MYRLYFTTFPTKRQEFLRNHPVFAEKQNMFRHRILDAFQDYPPFQSATKSSFLVMLFVDSAR